MAYTNSHLVAYTNLSPNHSGLRTHSIDRITPHCVVGQLSAESICGCFTSTSRQASCVLLFDRVMGTIQMQFTGESCAKGGGVRCPSRAVDWRKRCLTLWIGIRT